MALFELAIPIVLRHEGGYVNDPNDAGGETNFGISKRSYPDVDIKNLTVADASAIYFRDWWTKYNYGAIIPQAVASKVFDTSVNLGPSRAHKMLQEAAGATADGVLGPATLAVVNMMNSLTILFTFQNLQASYYRNLVLVDPTLQKFLAGWIARAYDRS
jgi:lysozyme family protein